MKPAKDLSLQEAARGARGHRHAALAAGAALRIGRGSGPVRYFHRWWSRLMMKLAKGLSLQEAVRETKDYLHAMLATGACSCIGQGNDLARRWWRA